MRRALGQLRRSATLPQIITPFPTLVDERGPDRLWELSPGAMLTVKGFEPSRHCWDGRVLQCRRSSGPLSLAESDTGGCSP